MSDVRSGLENGGYDHDLLPMKNTLKSMKLNLSLLIWRR